MKEVVRSTEGEKYILLLAERIKKKMKTSLNSFDLCASMSCY